MIITEGYYAIGESKLHYLQFGSGKNLLITFHGFNDSANLFLILAPSLQVHYTIISVSLPFHGLSKWKKDQSLTTKDVNEFTLSKMKEFNCDKFSLAGFSLGGKLVFAVFNSMPEKIDRLWLFSPDGLKNNIWYNIAIYPSWGQAIFKYILHNPKGYLKLLFLFEKIKLISKTLYLFLQRSMDTEEKRILVWDVWMCLKGFEIPQWKLKLQMKKYPVKTFLFFGKFDDIIKPKVGKKFVRGLDNVELIILNKGHFILKDYLNPYILARLS